MAVSIEKLAGGIAVVTLKSEPVNIMHYQFWEQLLAAVEQAEADTDVRAVVFRSGLKRSVFTAGLDIKELYVKGTNEERFHKYWAMLSKVLTKIYYTPLMTCAAIKGQCPAGGCAMALCCDHRVITSDGSMGLNEVALGMGGVPDFWGELMQKVIGERAMERMVQTGDLAKAPELLTLQMVDQVVGTPDELMPAAVKEAARWLRPGDHGRVASKQKMRRAFHARWVQGARAEGQYIWESINTGPVAANIEKVIAQLSGAGKKKKAKM